MLIFYSFELSLFLYLFHGQPYASRAKNSVTVEKRGKHKQTTSKDSSTLLKQQQVVKAKNNATHEETIVKDYEISQQLTCAVEIRKGAKQLKNKKLKKVKRNDRTGKKPSIIDRRRKSS